MATDPKLERYLSSLERALKPLPVSDRADIVTEIKSHVLTAMEREPKPAIDDVLRALGEPEMVANRYLMERGHQTVKPPISPIVKWLVIGFLGTMALFLMFAALLLSHFSPVLSINDKEERVTILGGLIDIDGKKGKVKIGSSEIEGMTDENRILEGIKPVGKDVKKFQVKFRNGKVELRNSDSNELRWSCRTSLLGQDRGANFSEKGAETTLDLESLRRVRCEVSIPKGLTTDVKGENGKIVLDRPRFPVDAELRNGKIAIFPSTDEKYAYQIKVERGKADSFESATGAGVIEIRARVSNGRISRDEESEGASETGASEE